MTNSYIKEEPQNVTIRQAANLTGLSVSALRNGVRQGKFPVMFIGVGRNKKMLFNRQLLTQAIEQEMCNQMMQLKMKEDETHGKNQTNQ